VNQKNQTDMHGQKSAVRAYIGRLQAGDGVRF